MYPDSTGLSVHKQFSCFLEILDVLHKRRLLLVRFQTQRTLVQSTGTLMVELGVETGSPDSSRKQTPLLPQTQEIVDVFPKIISSALLLSQPSGQQTDCRRTAALGECTTHPCCLK